jgi:hypothetical protein
MKLILREKKQKLKGGLGDKKSLEDFDQEEVKLGLKAEMEHTDDKEVASEIVADHLTEDPKYYSKLKGAGLEEYKTGFGGGKMGNSKHAQGIASTKTFPFTKENTGGRLKRVKKAAKKGPITVVGGSGIGPAEGKE